ncbi:MAG TPA: Hpt domain-containing protein [Pseudolabrys sp.]|nr:Hpt domain-containing protein [Pseudolabrys sp.]
MAPRKDTPTVMTYADCEVIMPNNALRKAISQRPLDPNDDPVARAEAALADLSNEFGTWMETECTRLNQARDGLKKLGFTAATKEALFHAAHDIKGEAATFGYPAVAGAADSLCRLIEHTPDPTRIPMQLIDQHVDAVRAIIREYDRSDAKDLSAQLTSRLREVTDEFLVHENRNRPGYLERLGIVSPPLAP